MIKFRHICEISHDLYAVCICVSHLEADLYVLFIQFILKLNSSHLEISWGSNSNLTALPPEPQLPQSPCHRSRAVPDTLLLSPLELRCFWLFFTCFAFLVTHIYFNYLSFLSFFTVSTPLCSGVK